MSVRAAVMRGPGLPLELHTFPDPEPAPGEVILETVASEVCGTDVHLWHGRLAGVPYPIIPGHVSVGRVKESNGVDRDALGEPLAEGDLVTFLDVHGTCHRCFHCAVALQPNRCAARRVYGITFPLEEGLLGGWSEVIRLLPGVNILKLPGSIGAERFIGGGCGLFTGFAAVERGGLRMGETVVVQGCGPLGLYATALARDRGARKVLVIGAPANRLTVAKDWGADDTLNLDDFPDAEQRREWVLERTM
ncbi:MAG: alcohol dehydrogenase catalytic domain-containing protein, partial [Gemmatimonadota bacterium]